MRSCDALCLTFQWRTASGWKPFGKCENNSENMSEMVGRSPPAFPPIIPSCAVPSRTKTADLRRRDEEEGRDAGMPRSFMSTQTPSVDVFETGVAATSIAWPAVAAAADAADVAALDALDAALFAAAIAALAWATGLSCFAIMMLPRALRISSHSMALPPKCEERT